MFVGCGVGAYTAGIFHLFTHASFKALLFLGAGSVIHALHHEQDMRRMGGLARKLPITWLVMLIGTLALTGVGIPHVAGFAGFHSKDAIIEAAYAADTPSQYAFWGLVVSALMTSFYSWRLMFMTFHGAPRADHHAYEHAHESPLVMLVPLVVLAIGAAFSGLLFEGLFLGQARGEFWGNALVGAQGASVLDQRHELPDWVPLAPTLAMAAGFALAGLYYVVAPSLPALTARLARPLYLFLLNKWYFDELYDWLFVRPALRLGRFLWKKGDEGMIDGVVDGLARAVLWGTGRVIRLQTGYVYHYAFAMLIGVAALLTYFMLHGGGQ
jgi:NADH-quinone oxidoreductase subunit L